MSNTSNIKTFETIIRSQLKSLGYFNIEIKSEYEKSFDVIAEGTLRKIFLRVLVKGVSEHLNDLTHEEITLIKYNATHFSKEPWLAIMSVNERDELVDRIKWRNLSKENA